MHYQQLTRDQRYIIYALKREGFSQAYIARRVGVHRSTVGREFKRNKHKRGWRPKLADQLAMARRHRSGHPTKMTARTKARIRHYLKKKWSPEQISGRLKRSKGFSISYQAIYRYLYQDRMAGGTLYKGLRRKKPYRRGDRKYGPIKGRISIDNRPAVVDERGRIGDWEIDTVLSGDRKSALVTIVERVSKYVIIGKLERNQARLVAQGVVKLMTPLRNFVHSITSDNGAEFACHKYIATKLETDFFFAHPYKPCERGLNENTNSLIREYLPKGVSFKDLTQTDAFSIQKILNRRPRKTLDYQTPNEVLWPHVALAS